MSSDYTLQPVIKELSLTDVLCSIKEHPQLSEKVIESLLSLDCISLEGSYSLNCAIRPATAPWAECRHRSESSAVNKAQHYYSYEIILLLSQITHSLISYSFNSLLIVNTNCMIFNYANGSIKVNML